jgi:hypothetical protein
MSRHASAVEIQFQLHATVPRTGKTRPDDPPSSGHGRPPRLTEVMAMAISFQDMIERHEVQNYADLARLGCLTRERMSQVMELVWLAPDIQEEILKFPPTATRFPISEAAARKVASLLAWQEQRHKWQQLKLLLKLA